METTRTDDEALAPGNDKLIPEWSVSADDQIVGMGLLVIVAFLSIFGWNLLTGDDGDSTDTDLAVVAGPVVAAGADLPGLNTTGPAAAAGEDTDAETGADDVEAITSSTTAAPATTVDLGPDVAAAIDPFGSASGTVEGSTALLTGFVGSETDKTAAGEAAAAVAGITAVDNQLVPVEAGVRSALEASGVADPDVVTVDTAVTVRGEVQNEAARAAALDAALAVPGVTAVVDELTLPAAESTIEELNALFELEPIQFASGSAQILDASFGALDRAAAVLTDNTAAIDIQGYTDVRGPEVTNLTLSQARADAVLDYLVGKGVAADNLTSTGYGETSQFADGDSPDALAANRRVRFELI